MADLATLAIRVENGDVVKATTALNTMAVAGGKTEAATTRLTRRMALLEIEARQMDATMAKSSFTLTGLATKMGASEAAAARLSSALGALSAVAALGFIGHKTIEETEAAQAAMAQLESAVQSTGGTAGRTVAQLDALSMALQKQTTFSDEAVKGAETMLLAFNKIKGNEFDRATKTAADLAARMGGDLNDAALKVGKALQDPEHGLTQLRRAGIVFSDSQIAVVKSLYETGRVAEGMNLILDEMDKKFGGAAAAARDTLGGALAGLKNAWGDLFEVTKNSSQGTVAAINTLTTALENSGLTMNKVLHDAAHDWTVLSAAAQKANEIMSLPIGPGFFAKAKAISDRIDFDLNTKLAALNNPDPAKTGRGGGTGTDDAEASKRAQKQQQELAQMDLEIARQNELNAVTGASSATIAMLNNAYDARASRAKNAIDHTTAETAALNKRTDALLAAKDAAVLEAAAQANRKQVSDAQRGDSTAVRDARQALELAGLSDEAAAQRRVDMQAENDLAAARLRFATMTRDLDKEQADVAAGILQREQDIYTSTVARVTAVRQIGHETAAVTAEMDRQKKVQDDAAREQERRDRQRLRATTDVIGQTITDVLNHRNPLPGLVANLKAAAIRAFSEALAQRFLASKFAQMLGIGIESAAKTQDTAAIKMQTAAELQKQAAEDMLRAAGMSSTSTSTTNKDGNAAKVPAWVGSLKKIGEAAAVAYGGYQAGVATGQATYSQNRGKVANYVIGAVGGAISGAATGAAIGSAFGPIGTAAGAAIGAVAGFVGGIVGVHKASKEAAKATAELRTALALTMDGLRAEVGKDALASSIAQVRAQGVQVRKQIEEAYQFGGKNSDTVRERNKLLEESLRLEAERIQQLREEAAVLQQRQIEDYKERELRAKGLTKEADNYHFVKQQERERQDLVTSFGDVIDAKEREILAAYDAAAAAEKVAYAAGKAAGAMNDFATAVRGGPSGFKLEGYIQQFATGRALPAPQQPFSWPTLPAPLSPPSSPTFSQSATTGMTGKVATPPVVINNPVFQFPNVTDGKVAAKAFLAELDKAVATTGGLNTTRAVALNKMTVS